MAESICKDKHMLYSGADIFVSPATCIQETFGLDRCRGTILAYCVCLGLGRYRDLVPDGETGFLVPSLFPSSVENLELRDCRISMVEKFFGAIPTIDIPTLSQKIQTLYTTQHFGGKWDERQGSLQKSITVGQ